MSGELKFNTNLVFNGILHILADDAGELLELSLLLIYEIKDIFHLPHNTDMGRDAYWEPIISDGSVVTTCLRLDNRES